ncbi:MAG: cation transporter [Candidatus Margulisiibacteriota bacterium]|jgi:divalent metal cation (Fe/Co/Zn/Cd) transporter
MNIKVLWNIALSLAIVTVFYNIIEGLVSIYFGYTDQTLTLLGFGIDSFVEVLSGIGVWHMIVRIKRNDQERDSFEKTALKITGISFYLLTIGLILTVAYNIYIDHKPITTSWGIIISVISILTMVFLMKAKMFVGERLSSDAIIADANCTKTCVYLSVILLVSSVLYELFKVGYIDSLGTIGIAYYAFMEGRESIDKSKGKECCGSCRS